MKNETTYIISGRRSGKTTSFIKHASDTKGIIVCSSELQAKYISKMAKELGYLIKEPISFRSYLRLLHGNGVSGEKYYFDEFGEIVASHIEWHLKKDMRNVIEVTVDESSLKRINNLFESLDIRDVDGNNLNMKLEIYGIRGD